LYMYEYKWMYVYEYVYDYVCIYNGTETIWKGEELAIELIEAK